MTPPIISVEGLEKTFVLHVQGGATLPVLKDINMAVAPGECVVLHGPSGAGKSTLLRSMYANYLPQAGRVLVRHRDQEIDLLEADPHVVLDIRRWTIGFVSQFLRAIPRVPTLEIVAEPLKARGVAEKEAHGRARELLDRLQIPERMWSLSPVTFSGGEQQRVNIARSFTAPFPVLLLDEPTAALDAENRERVVQLIHEAKNRGAAIIGIFHDREVREAVADRYFEMAAYGAAA